MGSAERVLPISVNVVEMAAIPGVVRCEVPAIKQGEASTDVNDIYRVVFIRLVITCINVIRIEEIGQVVCCLQIELPGEFIANEHKWHYRWRTTAVPFIELLFWLIQGILCFFLIVKWKVGTTADHAVGAVYGHSAEL